MTGVHLESALEAASLVAILRHRARQQGDQTVFTYLREAAGRHSLTFVDLDRRARALGARLQSLGASGERVLLLYPPGLEFATAFFGCLYAGAVAVLSSPPRLNRPSPRLRAILADTGAAVALSSSQVLDDLERRLRHTPELEELRWVATDALDDGLAEEWREPRLTADTVALLQYTSGSTSASKGVVLSHGNLLANLELVRRGFQFREDDRVVLWLPPFHDMGLTGGVLVPVYMGISNYLMSPASFLQRPIRWLQAISETRATVSGGPDFAYQLCLRKTTAEQRHGLDLSSWRLAFCGAEPIRPTTLARFHDTYARCGLRHDVFYPCYGLAEATLIVSGGDGPGSPKLATVRPDSLAAGQVREVTPGTPGSQTLVGCGGALGEVVIVDPASAARCSPGQVGEIWTAGASIAQGYWNRPEETEETFRACLDTGEGPYLRTGDLGFLDRGGELFVTGRLKDMIIIRGTNHYPQDIELVVGSSHPALEPGCGAAFAIERGGEERLVVVQELRRQHRRADVEEVVRAIRKAVAQSVQLQVHAVSLLKPRSIPKTSSGKIRRNASRDAFLDGTLKVLGSWRLPEDGGAPPAAPEKSAAVPATAGAATLQRPLGGRGGDLQRPLGGRGGDLQSIRDYLVSRVAEQAKIPAREVGFREPFLSLGLDSAQAVSLTGDLETWLGRPLSPTLLYEYPDVESLALHLADDGAATSGARHPPAGRPQRGEPGEPVAILGLGCRFPGAHDPAAFWRLLRDGVDAVTEVPEERWNARRLYDPDPEAPGKVSTRWGGFLERIDAFDPEFFGISRREATRMDPQQRLLLETAWEALEDGGQTLERLAGEKVGVFVGISTNDYGRIQLSDPHLIDAYAGTGNAFSIAANRLSYVFGFTGPSLAVDTACSSSMVALHLACRSLREGESSVALAGGVNMLLSPAVTMSFTKAKTMAADGRCKSFDHRADGYVRSEGVGVVVLKPLARALADRDPIYAVLRGTAINQDGRTNGIMAPSRQAQEEVLRSAYADAGVSPGEVSYVEAHGTGTLLGDPIEAKALGAVLAEDREPGTVCALGSVKSNLGHLESAAGIAGLIKTALIYEHGEIPPSLHFQEPNPHIPFAELPLAVQRELGPWPGASGSAIAGVSSFGFGGTNAHAVLDRKPAPAADAARGAGEATASLSVARLLPLSARSAQALLDTARSMRAFLVPEDGEPPAFADVCHTAGERRTHHDHRLALVASTCEEAAARLDSFSRQESSPGLAHGRRLQDDPGVVFVFCGQGSQWWAMGRQLLEQEEVFRRALQEVDEELRRSAGFSLLDELRADEADSRLQRQEPWIAQPALFALQVALAALYRHWGIVAGAVVGHSMGEVAAAHVAGILSLGDAVRVIYHRGRVCEQASGQGKMAAVELSADEIGKVTETAAPEVAVVAINSSNSATISGPPAALDSAVAALERAGAHCRVLRVTYAGHYGPLMAVPADELGASLEGIEPHPAKLPMVSTLDAGLGDGKELDAGYWRRELAEPVRFAAALDVLLGRGHRTFVELSPHPVLAPAIGRCLRQRGHEGLVLPSLRRGEDERATMLATLGALYCQGARPAWERLAPGGRYVRLPSYPWQWERCWLESESARDTRADWGAEGDPEHPLLGRRIRLAHAPRSWVWENRLNLRYLPYLRDHQVQGVAVLPGTAYLEMVLAAGAEIFGGRPQVLRDISFRQPLFLPPEGSRTLQLSLSPGAGGQFHVYSRGDEESGPWTLHVEGTISESPAGNPARVDLTALRERLSEEVSGEDFYQGLHGRGFEYGPRFRGIDRLWKQDGEALAHVRTPPGVDVESELYQLHPALLDACAQVLLGTDGHQGLMLPSSVDEVRVHARPGPRTWSHGRLTRAPQQRRRDLVGDAWLLDEAGQVVVEASGLRFQYLDGAPRQAAAVLDDTAAPDDWLYEIRWQPLTAPETAGSSPSQGIWMIFADQRGVGASLAELWAERGQSCVLVRPGQAFAADGNRFRVRPGERDDLARLFASALVDGQLFYRGVVHLWSLDSPVGEETSRESLADQASACAAIVELLRQMAGQDSARLWLVTRGAQAVTADETASLALGPASLWGLGRTVELEQPSLWGGLIDLDPSHLPAASAAHLERWLDNELGENQLALRGATARAARLERRQASTGPSAVTLRPDASYLVTGGLGELGLALAGWLVEQGARRLILLSRTELPPRGAWREAAGEERWARRIAAVRDLEARGASVHLAPADVSDETALAEFLERYRGESWPPIRGVAHAAGVLADRTLLELDGDSFAEVWRPKVLGAWLLDRLLDDAPLDFFVSFSSAAALLGSAGQANYAAANAFLDTLAHARKGRGKAGLSINWGPWAEVGLAARPERGERLAAQGIRGLPPRLALETFGRLVAENASQVGVLAIDWARLFEVAPALSRLPLVAHLGGPKPEPHAAQVEDRQALAALAPERRIAFVTERLREEVGQVVGVSAARLDPEQPLLTLGLDSLMGVELKNRIEERTGVAVPIVKLLEGPSVSQLAALLVDLIEEEPTVEEPAATAASWIWGESGAPSAEPTTPLVEIAAGGSKPPFFCVHPGALEVGSFARLAHHLGTEQPFYVLQPPELDRYRVLEEGTVEELALPELARRSIAALRGRQAQGPYHLGGWSMGGLVAYEIAQQLRATGDEVAVLALFDSPAPAGEWPESEWPHDYADEDLVLMFARFLGARFGKLLELPPDDHDLDLSERFRQILIEAKRVRAVAADADVSQMRSLFEIYRNGLSSTESVFRSWRPEVYPGRIDIFRVHETFQVLTSLFAGSTAGWDRLAAAAVIHQVPGDHYTMLVEPAVQVLGEKLRGRLDTA